VLEHLQIRPEDFNGEIRARPRYQLVEAHLDRLREAEANARHGIENGGLHLCDQIFASTGRRPFLLRFENDEHIGHLHSHDICRHLGAPCSGHHLHDFRKSAKYPFNF
jgi:hypothetical protein